METSDEARCEESFGSSFSPRARRARRHLVRDAQLILKSPVFDVPWYAEGQRKLKGDRLDIALHYLRKGAAKGRNPSARFDAAWYLERYPDVAAAGINPLLHYLEHGAAEGRETRAAERPEARAVGGSAAAHQALSRRFSALEPLRTFRGPREPSWVTMVTDSINAGSLFGGVGTAMVLSALIARRVGARLRLVTRTQPAHPDNFAAVLSALRVPWEGNIEFVHSPAGGGREVPVGDCDIFLTTSWWTTRCVRRAVDPRRVIYLLQEDERMFYPYGDERLRCSETLGDPDVRFVVNTEALFRHFVDGPEPLPNLRTNGVWFEPAFPAATDNRPPRPEGGKQNFLFYARPHNLRNLYWRGLEAIEACLEEGILDPQAWEIHFVGRDLEDIVLPRGVRPRLAQNLPWAEYLGLVRRMDMGLSLMDTPHPSYPPLDLAAAGAVVVTNRHGPKTSLARYSDNILCVEPTVEGLKRGIADAVELAADGARRRANHARNRLGRDWEAAFEPVLHRLFPDGVVAAAAD
jgi:WsaF, C-terminal domain/WsaF, N-terminal domain